MKPMNLLASSAMAASVLFAAPAAHAAHTIEYNVDPGTGSFTAAFGNPDPAATFDDLFSPFTVLTQGFLSGTLSTVGLSSANDLDFTLARVTGFGGSTVADFFPLTITAAGGNPDALEMGQFLGVPIGPGTYNLRVAGRTPGVNGSYAGTLAFDAVAAVPEPATWAMMLLGFGLVGGALRRRRGKENVRVRYAF